MLFVKTFAPLDSTVAFDDQSAVDPLAPSADELKTFNYDGDAATHPAFCVGEVQIEEAEHDTTTVTSLRLESDGHVTFIMSDGPMPDEVQGEWSMTEEGAFDLRIKRIFTNDLVAYSVTRNYRGGLEMSSAPTVSGEIMVDDSVAGYFSMIIIPDEEEAEEPGKLLYPDSVSPKTGYQGSVKLHHHSTHVPEFGDERRVADTAEPPPAPAPEVVLGGLFQATFAQGPLGMQLAKGPNGEALVAEIIASGQGEALGVSAGDVLIGVEGRACDYEEALEFLELVLRPAKLTFERP